MLNEDVEKELLEKASFYAKEQLKKMGTAEFFDNYANIKNISKFKAFWVGYDKAYPVVYKNLSDNIFLTLKEEYIKA